MSSQTRVFQLDDWTGITDPALRKRLQNKLNQRALRRLPKRILNFQSSSSSHSPWGAFKQAPRSQTLHPCASAPCPGLISSCLVDYSIFLIVASSTPLPDELTPFVGARKRRERQTALVLKSKDDSPEVRRYALLLPRPDDKAQEPQQQLLPRPTSLSQAVELMTRFHTEACERYYAADPCLDHLFTLSKFNVLRAFVDNLSALGLTFEEMDNDIISPFSTTMPRHYDIGILPPSLLPTTIQGSTPHHPWLDCFPFPRMRDNLLTAVESFNDCDLCTDLMNPTTGDIGVMVWGDPWLPQNWEFSAVFVRKWAWVIEGCPEIFVYSNCWRARRGLNRLTASSME